MMGAVQWLDVHRAQLQRSLSERASPSPSGFPHEEPLVLVEALADAVRSGRSSLFYDYVAWAKIIWAQQGVDPRELREDLERLIALLEQYDEEYAIELTFPLWEVVSRFDELPTATDSYLVPASNPHAALAQQYLDLLLEGRRQEAISLMAEVVEGGVPIREVYLGVFQPVQYEVGRLWQMNQVTVAQEHLCTATTQLVMSRFYSRLFSGTYCGHRIVVACVSGDLHEVGARFLADFFEMEGWDTTYLGANAEVEDIVGAAQDEGAHVVAISATLVHHVERVREATAALRQEVPQAAIIVGGYPFTASPGLWRQLGADGSAPNAEAAVQLARQVVAQ